MNPLYALIGIGGLALVSGAAASIPAINTNSDDTSFPIDYTSDEDDPLNLYPSTTPDPNEQINAFCAVIRAGESSDNYYAKVGGGNIATLAVYPTWSGYGNSHAVGAYQFQPQTWSECATALGLKDFSKASQDKAAVFLLKRRGAYNAIINGDIDTACDLLKNEWEMFQQSKWTSDKVASLFISNGGYMA